MLMACNCIAPQDVSEHYLSHPEWHALRVPCIEVWPEGWADEKSRCRELWADWHERFLAGRGDKSFNDGAYLGGTRAAKALGARVRYIEPGEGSDREAGLRLLAAEGMDLVVAVGFIFTDDVNLLAKEYPNVRFADVDYAVATDSLGRPLPMPPNLVALKFREEQGSFLVGALAALVGKSKKVGFVGGMDIALIHKFEAGYRAGVKHVCPDCEVMVNYAGVTPEAFRNPGRGKEMALAMYNQGVNVIFHASGSTGLGMFEAARAMGKGHYGIGVDADQYSEAPGYVLTSMVKGVSESVYAFTVATVFFAKSVSDCLTASY
jgi:basic membrane protein A